MITRFAHVRQRIVVAILTLGLLLGGATPHLGGETTLARKDKQARAERREARLIQSFANPSAIAIPASGKAATYPSTIEVSGFEAEISDLAVTLHRFSHTAPEDVDVVLVGPEGQTAIFLSDAGGLNPVTNVTMTFDDQAATEFPNPVLTTGTFRPYNGFVLNDNFPPPAPTPLSDDSGLHRFNGTDPNGAWSLFIVDDGAGQSGTLNGGWSLLITTENSDPLAAPDQFRVKAGKRLTIDAPGVLENDSDPDGDPLSAELANTPRKGNLSLQSDGSFTYKAKKKAKGKDSFTYLAQDPDGDDGLATVSIKIKKSKKGKKRGH